MVLQQRLAYLATCVRRCYANSSQHVNHDVRVRFAPSPTGMIHLGGLRTALYNYIYAKSCGGKFILRIEDTDQSRLVDGAVKNVQEALTWAGLKPDEGPADGGEYGPYTQSQRLHIYEENVNILLKNKSAYRCFCTPQRLNLLRKEALRNRQNPRYDNRCRSLTTPELDEKIQAGLSHVVRFKLSDNIEPFDDLVYGRVKHDIHSIEGDPVLLKTDKFPTYHLANVVDDHLMNITHVLRGMEWLTSTSKHLLLYKAFNWKPPAFAHLPLLMNEDGSKLSKRQGDIFVDHFKGLGYMPEAVLNFVTSCGSGYKDNNSIKDLNELINQFSLDHVTTHSAMLDMKQLARFSRGHIGRRLMDKEQQQTVIEELRTMVETQLRDRILSGQQLQRLSDEYLLKVLQARKAHINQLGDLMMKKYDYLWLQPTLTSDRLNDISTKAKEIASILVADLQICDNFEEDNLAIKLRLLLKKENLKAGEFWKILRLSLSGLEDGPSSKEMLATLGKNESLRRLQAVVSMYIETNT